MFPSTFPALRNEPSDTLSQNNLSSVNDVWQALSHSDGKGNHCIMAAYMGVQLVNSWAHCAQHVGNNAL